MKIKNKILFSLSLFFIFLLLILNNNIYASSSNITEEKMSVINELMSEHSDCDTWVSITYRSQDAIFLTSSNDDYNLYVSGSTIGACNGKYVQWYCFWYYADTNTYNLFYSGSQNKHGEMTISTVYSNKTIYADSNGEEIFFHLPVTETVTTTIPALETVEQIPTAMVETLKMIIPVGLVIFGILLLILLVKSVILRMT